MLAYVCAITPFFRFEANDSSMSIGFGFVVGLALRLIGGGGSILAVPLLIYGLGVDVKAP